MQISQQPPHIHVFAQSAMFFYASMQTVDSALYAGYTLMYFLILTVVDYQEKRIPAKDRPSPAKNVGNRDSVISKPSLHRKHTPLACATLR